MVNQVSRLKFGAHARHKIWLEDIVDVVCHRLKNQVNQFLVKWNLGTSNTNARTVYSWHDLEELEKCLKLVQLYVENQSKNDEDTPTTLGLPHNRKRKSPADEEHVTSRDFNSNGLLTPGPSGSFGSRSPSVTSTESNTDESSMVYNGVLKRKEGRITAMLCNIEGVTTSADVLPTKAMTYAAVKVPLIDAQRYIRQAFVDKLAGLRGVSLENQVDASTPSLDFNFIASYVLMDGVYAADPDSYEGCDKPCRPDMGQNIGCEYTQDCGCLEYAAVNEDTLKRQRPEIFERYQQSLARGYYFDTVGLPKRFPYTRSKGGNHPPLLQAQYRESRHPIYECNQNCNCGPKCKSRLVQHGRRVPLTIFKTESRGWGVYCNEDLSPGEFIDTYLGEVITNEEADRRENVGGKDKASYLYSLDKFAEDDDISPETCFVVDGEYMGGPTRFINHSCEPNCRQYTVSYNKHDRRLYDLAFFAYKHIPVGTELTFDYMDKDEEEEEDVVRRREEAARDPMNFDKTPCLCGAKKCRGFLWFSG